MIISSVNALLKLHNKQWNEIARPSFGKFKGFSVGDMFMEILSTDTLKDASIGLNCSEQTIRRTLRGIVNTVYSSKGGSISYYLLLSIGRRFCGKCGLIKEIAAFSKARSICKECTADSFHDYYIDNKSDIISNVSNRRAFLLNATPSWADLDKIKEIYNSCPRGYHVDHIIPLQGTLVCGLHVENNLQHLLAEDNLSKGNKFIIG